MAIFPLTDVTVTVNSVDLSDYVVSCTVTHNKELLDITRMGHVARMSIGALESNSVSIDFQQDFAASQVYATLASLVGVPTNVTVKPTSGATSASNPAMTLTGTVLEGDGPIAGSVGDLATISVTFTGGSWSVATAP
jgi:hypothetical protein